MTWWNRKSKPKDEITDPVGSTAGTYSVPLDAYANIPHPEATGKVIPYVNVIAETAPQKPEPDLSTKPEDYIGYCFGYVCPKKHVNSTFENITVDGYKERRACQYCGGVGKPAVVKRTAEPIWGMTNRARRLRQEWRGEVVEAPTWSWSLLYDDFTIRWMRLEFVHYLDTPKPRKKK
jgi:hypothetical protein